MEILFSVLALVISLAKVIFMWLNYRDCKKANSSRDTKNSESQKNTD